MIRPLRRRHLWMTAIIALGVVVLYFAALAARPERALQNGLPRGIEGTRQPVDEIGEEPAGAAGAGGVDR